MVRGIRLQASISRTGDFFENGSSACRRPISSTSDRVTLTEPMNWSAEFIPPEPIAPEEIPPTFPSNCSIVHNSRQFMHPLSELDPSNQAFTPRTAEFIPAFIHSFILFNPQPSTPAPPIPPAPSDRPLTQTNFRNPSSVKQAVPPSGVQASACSSRSTVNRELRTIP